MKIKVKFIILLMIMAILCHFVYPTIVLATEKKEEIKQDKEITLIPITKEDIHDENIMQITETFIRKAEVLVDEQEKVPTTPYKEIEKEQFDKISTDTWCPSSKGDTVSCYIDLKAIYEISYIAYKDTFGNPTVVFSSGEPFKWNEMMTRKMDNYMTWNLIPISNIQTRYIQIKTIDGTNSGISEIAIYGKKIGEEEKKEGESNLGNPDFGITMDKAVGINAFIDDPLDILKVGGVIREYHNLRWTLDQNLYQNKFTPSYGGKWDFDAYYKMLKEENIVVAPCIQGTSKAITNLPNMTMNEKPIPKGANSLDPVSYKEHASTMFQYAARYGAKQVEESKLLLADDQEKKSGLGYLTYYENSNEPDKTWEGLDSYFSPYEMAAMCSADYDGHEGSLGDTYGIKNADPDAKLVMGGLCHPESMVEYLDLMKLWFESNRKDKQMALDVINFHYYTGTNAPEQSEFRNICESITNWRNQNARDKEVWLTEFGWDSNINSPIHAPNNETQRDWLIRTYLIAESVGIDRSTMYMLRDASWGDNPGKYATSGLTTEKGAWTKKPSWFGVYTLKDTLEGYEFKEVVQETDSLYIYKFVNKETNKECYAIWSPTSNGFKIENYEFNVGNKTRPTLTALEDGYIDGNKTKLKIQNGKVTFDVTESPVFLTLDVPEGSYEAPTNERIDLSNGTMQVEYSNIEGKTEEQIQKIEEEVITNFRNLFDEQGNTPIAPKMNFKGEFRTGWGTTSLGKNYPVSAILDLKEEYQISSIGLYDTTAIGILKFYAGTPEKWEEEPFLEINLDYYKTWRNTDTSTTTKYVKIVKENHAELSEIAFYGYSIKEAKKDPNIELNTMIPEADKGKLKEIIQKAEAYIQEEYTKDSWRQMQLTLDKARQIVEEKKASQETVDSICKELNNKIEALVKIEIPKPDPEEPTIPEEPEPEEPNPTPIPPEDPSIPEKPEKPNPTPPEQPDTSEKPEQKPEEPKNNENNKKPIIKDNTTSNKKIPQTGEESKIYIIITILILSVISTVIIIKIYKVNPK